MFGFPEAALDDRRQRVDGGPTGLVSAVALRLRSHRRATFTLAALRAAQALHNISQQRIPPRKPGERLGLRGARVTALALERQHVLAEVIGKAHNSKGPAGRHHPAIVATVERKRPSSTRVSPSLDIDANATTCAQ
jgi:hypothetical protein